MKNSLFTVPCNSSKVVINACQNEANFLSSWSLPMTTPLGPWLFRSASISTLWKCFKCTNASQCHFLIKIFPFIWSTELMHLRDTCINTSPFDLFFFFLVETLYCCSVQASGKEGAIREIRENILPGFAGLCWLSHHWSISRIMWCFRRQEDESQEWVSVYLANATPC